MYVYTLTKVKRFIFYKLVPQAMTINIEQGMEYVQLQ